MKIRSDKGKARPSYRCERCNKRRPGDSPWCRKCEEVINACYVTGCGKPVFIGKRCRKHHVLQHEMNLGGAVIETATDGRLVVSRIA